MPAVVSVSTPKEVREQIEAVLTDAHNRKPGASDRLAALHSAGVKPDAEQAARHMSQAIDSAGDATKDAFSILEFLVKGGATIPSAAGEPLMQSALANLVDNRPGAGDHLAFLVERGVAATPEALNQHLYIAARRFALAYGTDSAAIANLIALGARLPAAFTESVAREAADRVLSGRPGAPAKLATLAGFGIKPSSTAQADLMSLAITRVSKNEPGAAEVANTFMKLGYPVNVTHTARLLSVARNAVSIKVAGSRESAAFLEDLPRRALARGSSARAHAAHELAGRVMSMLSLPQAPGRALPRP